MTHTELESESTAFLFFILSCRNVCKFVSSIFLGLNEVKKLISYAAWHISSTLNRKSEAACQRNDLNGASSEKSKHPTEQKNAPFST
jgi:hypothetical protein